MLGVKCSLPATVWTEGCRADSGEGGGSTVRCNRERAAEEWVLGRNTLFGPFSVVLGKPELVFRIFFSDTVGRGV